MLELLSESVFMIPLALCSLVAVAVICHRFVSLRTGLVLPRSLVGELLSGKRNQLVDVLRKNTSSLGRVCERALSTDHPDRAAAVSSAEASAREEVTRLQAGLTSLEVIITIAPLLGLLGTVSGLVTVFSGLGGGEGTVASSGSDIARGISEALSTTIVGLVVAVPAVMAHGYFQRKIDRLTVRMERVLHQAIERFYP